MSKLAVGVLLLFSASCARRIPPSAEALGLQDDCHAAFEQADWVKARASCAEATRLAPSLEQAWHEQGIASLFLGDAKAAKQPLEKAAALNDKRPRTYNGLGIVAFVDHDYGRAESMFKRALELRSDYPDAAFNRAWNYWRWRKVEEAKRTLRELIGKHPELGFPFQLFAIILLTEDRTQNAQEAALAAIQAEPRECRNWLTLGNAYFKERRYEEAEEALRSCVELCPKDPVCGAALESAEAREQFPLADPRDLLP